MYKYLIIVAWTSYVTEDKPISRSDTKKGMYAKEQAANPHLTIRYTKGSKHWIDHFYLLCSEFEIIRRYCLDSSCYLQKLFDVYNGK
ncbi:unnamed protein product [Acanthoscelides obtectus]|uniref:Uncharacterized protein n=1 Tax=Acanthoscelides obtectus TaxID=200917 RepID=A0A9P0PTX3_ACAOB|nr:unnamed protein product [Acanthoscelides obtectus]CAK1654435.1 hypothetical protein AOBTE_LOCUS18591 [Acanthoscelides obtectus]